MNHQAIPKTARIFGYLIAILVNMIGWVIVNNLLNWNVPFVTSRLAECLWAINLSIAVALVCQMILLFYDPIWLRHLLQVVMSSFALVSLVVFYRVFPLDFGAEVWNQAIRLGLGIVLIILPIAILVEFIRAVCALLELSEWAAAGEKR